MSRNLKHFLNCSHFTKNLIMIRCFTLLLVLVSLSVNAQIKSPSEFLGYDIGTQFTRHADVVGYFEYIANNSQLVTYDSYGFVPRQPYAVMQTQNSITIKCHSNKFEEGTLEYGFFPDTLDKAKHENKKAKKHSLTIDGLNECTKYYYKVSSGSLEIDNEDRSFKTLCKNADSQKIWVIGDSGKVGANQTEVYKQMLNRIDYDYNKLDSL